MTKMLILDTDKCAGCRLCEMVCSIKHTNKCNPSRACVHVVKWDEFGFFLPMRCQQCDDAACLAVCPRKAIYRNEEQGCVLIDYDKCIGCKACIIACPFGAMSYDVALRRVVKCDLCNGDPQCVKFCPMEAIEYIDSSCVNLKKMREAGFKIANLISALCENDKNNHNLSKFSKHI